MKKLLILIFGLFIMSCQTIDNDIVEQLGTDGTGYVFMEEDVISNNPEINEHYMTFKAHYLDSIDYSNTECQLDSLSVKYSYFKAYLRRLGYSSEIHNLNTTTANEFRQLYYDNLLRIDEEIKRLKHYGIVFAIILIWGAILLYSYMRKNVSFRSILTVSMLIALFSALLLMNVVLLDEHKESLKHVERDTYRQLLKYENTT